MKPFAMGLLSLFVSLFSYAGEGPSALTAKTSISCEQVTGSSWYEIGLMPFESKRGYLIAVVLHDEESQSSRLVLETSVYETKTNNDVTFENAKGTVRLIVNYNGVKLYQGTLSILKDGPGSVHQEVECYKNGTITYDRISKPQPRISVGS